MDIEKLSYEEAYKMLEETLNTMEEGKLSLEDSVKEFTKASELYKHCEKLLKNAEGKVKIIIDNEKEEEFSVEV